MTPDYRNEYTLRCNRYALLFIAGGVLLLLIGSFVSGYYLGRQAGAERAGADPWAALAVPTTRRALTVPPPEGTPDGASGSPAADSGLAPDAGVLPPGPARAAPADQRNAPVAMARAPGAWCIQLFTRGELALAERDVAALSGRGLQARVETVTGANGPRYLVRLGEFTARAEAEQYAAALENRGLIADFIVMER